MLERRGADQRKDPSGTAAGSSSGATVLVLGALLDGIPESDAIGASLIAGGSVGFAGGRRRLYLQHPRVVVGDDGHETRWPLGPLHRRTVGDGRGRLDCGCGLGYALLGDAGDTVLAVTETFAGGAVLTMLADTMVPEAVNRRPCGRPGVCRRLHRVVLAVDGWGRLTCSPTLISRDVPRRRPRCG